MTAYLEQLERDLVEAIDRLEAEGPRRRYARSWRRPARSLRALALAAPLAILAVVVVGALVQSHVDDRPVVAPPPRPNVEHPTVPIPPGTPLRVVGDLVRIAPTTWRGQVELRARGDATRGRSGTLTVTGEVDVSPRPCCDTPHSAGRASTRTIRFTWTTTGGGVSGCIANRVLRRPHGRFVWDGIGRITRASGVLGRYRGLAAAIAGETPISTPGKAQIELGAANSAPRGDC